MSNTLEKELGIPDEATLIPDGELSSAASLQTASSTKAISVSRSTCQRPNGRCLLVGRQAATADLRIVHGSISRKHAVLYYLRRGDEPTQQFVIQDLGGKHGTTINGKRLVEKEIHVLSNGDSILFGNVRESVFKVAMIQRAQNSISTEADGTEESRKPEPLKKEEDSADGESSSMEALVQQAGKGLTGRAKRQAEIAAMMDSLERAPKYRKFEDTAMPLLNQERDNEKTASEKSTSKLLRKAYKLKLPISESFQMASKSDRGTATTCLAVDPAGSRFAVGNRDTRLRFYDFGGMDQGRHESFQTVTPDDGHLLVGCCYSQTGDRILVGTGSVQPVVLSREGEEIIKFVRGDMYVADQTKTTGHTAAVTSVDWHPLERDIVLTASLDGSARQWNLKGKTQFKMLVCEKVFQAKSARGQRTAVTCVTFHPGGREFAMGTVCGTIQIWSRSRQSGRPERILFAAHGEQAPISALQYSVDGTMIASRSHAASTVKVWNSRSISRTAQPEVECTGVPTSYEGANVAFSPDTRVICVPVSVATSTIDGGLQEKSSLNFFDMMGRVVFEWSLNCRRGPTVVKWHDKLNQIFLGFADGSIEVLYDPRLSTRGALTSVGKVGRGADSLADLLKSKAPKGLDSISGEILTPLYQTQQISEKKKQRAERKDPLKSREPERPITGKHKAGGQAGGPLSFAQFVSDDKFAKVKAIAGKDPREALFQYTEGKSFVGKAYEGNESSLAEKTAEEEEDERKS